MVEDIGRVVRVTNDKTYLRLRDVCIGTVRASGGRRTDSTWIDTEEAVDVIVKGISR